MIKGVTKADEVRVGTCSVVCSKEQLQKLRFPVYHLVFPVMFSRSHVVGTSRGAEVVRVAPVQN